MALSFRVIQLEDIPELVDYEQRKLIDVIPDENDREIHSWNARWRKESLENYLPLGWSFLVRDEDQENTLVGYFLAQPLLFFDGKTQSLWVEHISHSSLQARDQLCDLAYRMSREKNFQRVFFPNNTGIANSVAALKAEPWQGSILCVKTSKA